MSLRVTILGCGSSGGVPRVNGDWGVCDPNEPKNRRSRCSIYVEKWEGSIEPDDPKNKTCVLIDTAPDLREQFLANQIKRVDALLYTHDHADQSHGIDDLRAVAYGMRKRIPTYMDSHTKKHLYARFSYCFEMPEGLVHPAILDMQDVIADGDDLVIQGGGGDLRTQVFEVSHGPTPAIGFLLDGVLAYTPDVWFIADEIIERLEDVNVWIVDALRYNDHPTHAHADKTLSWIARSRAKKGVLTNMHIDMDYATLKSELFGRLDVAYDGMSFTL